MAYSYIKKMYGFEAVVGRRVRHETEGEGTVAPEDRSCQHYVMVKFDGRKHAGPCHPGELTDLS